LTEYKECQIIKHALMQYVNRLNISEKEREEENLLLDKYKNIVTDMQQRFRIKKPSTS